MVLICEQTITSNLPTQQVVVLFLLLQIMLFYYWLVMSHIIGCEGQTWVIVQSYKATYRMFQQCHLGTRSSTEGNIEGHRGTTIVYPKGACVNGVFNLHAFVFDQGLSTCWFYLTIHPSY